MPHEPGVQEIRSPAPTIFRRDVDRFKAGGGKPRTPDDLDRTGEAIHRMKLLGLDGSNDLDEYSVLRPWLERTGRFFGSIDGSDPDKALIQADEYFRQNIQHEEAGPYNLDVKVSRIGALLYTGRYMSPKSTTLETPEIARAEVLADTLASGPAERRMLRDIAKGITVAYPGSASTLLADLYKHLQSFLPHINSQKSAQDKQLAFIEGLLTVTV